MSDETLLAEIKDFGDYDDVQKLDDGTIIGIGNLLFTRAIYMDLNLYGWGRRFCFEDRPLADKEYAKLRSGDDEPSGWVARR